MAKPKDFGKDFEAIKKIAKEVTDLAHSRIDVQNPFKLPNIKQGYRPFSISNIAPSKVFTRTKTKKLKEKGVSAADGFLKPVTSEKATSIVKGAKTKHTNKISSKKAEAELHITEGVTAGYGKGKKRGKRIGRIQGAIVTGSTLAALDRMRGDK